MATLEVPLDENDHIQGGLDAPVTLLEYGDYQCSFCGRAYHVIKQLQKDYGPQLKFVFRNFPLSEIHRLAEPAAEVAEFAGAHGQFWEMHDALYENQDSLGVQRFLELADGLGLPETGLQRALAQHQFTANIRADFLGGVRSGVNGTPTFFINGVRHDGSYEYKDLAAYIDAHLAGKSKTA